MSEYLAKLQDDRRISYGILSLAAALAVLVVVVAVNKSEAGERSVTADQPASPKSVDGKPAETSVPTAERGEPAAPETVKPSLQDPPVTKQPREDPKLASKAAGLGKKATTTTTPPTTVPPTAAPAPETTAKPAPDPPAEPEPGPPPGETGFVDTGNGVFVPPVLLKIRYCESTDNYKARNPVSTAAGGYQFLIGSWQGYGHAAKFGVATADKATPAQQDQAALETWRAAGTRPWQASEHCWGS